MRLDDGDYWIDDYGAWNYVAFGQLCPFSSDPITRNRLGRDFAFRHLGMVRISKRPWSVAVQWDIAKACEESLSSARALLRDLSGVERAKLRFYFGGWTHEMFENVCEAFARLEKLRSYRNITPFPEVRIKPIGETEGEKTATPLIRHAQKVLAKHGRQLDADLCKGLAEANLLDRILLFQEEDQGSWFSYRYIGGQSLFSKIFGREASEQLIGKHCAIDPSRNGCGHSICRHYPRVLANGAEQIEQVFAPIKQDNDDGVWVSYQRIIIPCSTPDGRRLLMVLTDHTEESLIAA